MAYRFVTLPRASAVWPAAGAFVARGGARDVVICSIGRGRRIQYRRGIGEGGGRVQDARGAAVKVSNTVLNASLMGITCGHTAMAEVLWVRSESEKGRLFAR